MKKANKKRNPVAKQLRHFKQKVVKNKKAYDRKKFKITAEIVNGMCPTCSELTTLVGLDKAFYRCMNCGSDLEQHVNGKISYLPVLSSRKDGKLFVKEWLE